MDDSPAVQRSNVESVCSVCGASNLATSAGCAPKRFTPPVRWRRLIQGREGRACFRASAKSLFRSFFLFLDDSPQIGRRPFLSKHLLRPPDLTMASPANDPELLSFIQEFWAGRLPHSAIYQLVLSDVRFTHASKGIVRARLTLTKNHVNSHGGIHGSTSATIVDWVGGMAIAAWDKRSKIGVSTDIHVTYQSSAREGDEIEIEGVATKVGGTLAFTRCSIYKVVEGERGAVIAEGTHTKFVKI